MPTLNAYADAAPDLVSHRREFDATEQFHRRRAAEPRRVPGQLNRFGRCRKRCGRRQPASADRRAAPARAHHRSAQPVPRGTVVRHRGSRYRSRTVPHSILRASWCRPVSRSASSAIAIRRTCRRSPPRAARTARNSACPTCSPRFGRRSSSLTSAPTLQQYGNQGILLNSEGLKNWLFGPIDGPPRNTAQIGMPG